ncbi:MAG TPA: sulfite exporter TauE/SafE family protein [Balneolaceae bacterium]|nr:sulfite exporter TauE/SafE family protein [Balneolaceae bacterium]
MVWAWIGALFIGITLGLLGSGGSILTVPMLIYLVGEPEKLAIAESLGIVCAISFFGFLPSAINRKVHWRSILYFGVPGMVATYGGAFAAKFVSGKFQLMVFAVIMLLAAGMMFLNKRHAVNKSSLQHEKWKLILEGLAVGVITGFVGIGGGFIIVPALVLLSGLPIHLAVGTSLGIISMNSFIGFFKYMEVLGEMDVSINWPLIALFSVIGISGSFIGKRVGDYIPQQRLKKAFAAFLVVMSIGIVWTNF